jgi:hypothetical protein
LRPSVRLSGGQSDSGTGAGYSVTSLGFEWIATVGGPLFLGDPGRLVGLFGPFSSKFGAGFLQRANEAAQCHAFGMYLGACAMCGAAAESILLAISIAKLGNEDSVLKTYRAASGRKSIVDSIIGKAPEAIASPFRSATGLLSYWRDEAAHGTASEISEIEAHEALARLLRFAQFAWDNGNELTRLSPQESSQR